MDKDEYKLENNFDRDAFIFTVKSNTADATTKRQAKPARRYLMDYDHVGPWQNYFPLPSVHNK
jgi:hypothetical protein